MIHFEGPFKMIISGFLKFTLMVEVKITTISTAHFYASFLLIISRFLKSRLIVEVQIRTIYNEHYSSPFLLFIFILHFLVLVYSPFFNFIFEHHSSPFLNLDYQSTFEMIIFVFQTKTG